MTSSQETERVYSYNLGPAWGSKGDISKAIQHWIPLLMSPVTDMGDRDWNMSSLCEYPCIRKLTRYIKKGCRFV